MIRKQIDAQDLLKVQKFPVHRADVSKPPFKMGEGAELGDLKRLCAARFDRPNARLTDEYSVGYSYSLGSPP